MSNVHDTPVRRVLSKLSGVKRSDGGWVARCPAHGDKMQSLGIDVNEGRVLLRCHAGCEVERVVDAMGLRMADLFPPERTQRPVEKQAEKPPSSVTLAALAERKRLPVDFLRGLGWTEVVGHFGPYIEIPYARRGGDVHRVRKRSALVAKEGSSWGPGKGMVAYEPDHGALAAQEGYVVVVEGETDTATLLFAGIPAIGVPGANAVNVLELVHLEGLRCVFASRETDAAGEKFVAGVRERVKELGVEIPVHELKWPAAAKDPSALFIRDPEKFVETVHAALIEAAKPPPGPFAWRSTAQIFVG
jgi:hypothetical protein